MSCLKDSPESFPAKGNNVRKSAGVTFLCVSPVRGTPDDDAAGDAAVVCGATSLLSSPSSLAIFSLASSNWEWSVFFKSASAASFPFWWAFSSISSLACLTMDNVLELLAVLNVQARYKVLQWVRQLLCAIVACLRLVLWGSEIQHPQKVLLTAMWKQVGEDLLDDVSFHYRPSCTWPVSLFQLRELQCPADSCNLWQVEWQAPPKSWPQKVAALSSL